MINSRSRKEHKIDSRLDSDCALFSEIDSWASLSDKTRPFPYFNHRFKHEAVNQRKQDPYDCDASFLWVTEGCNVKLFFCVLLQSFDAPGLVQQCVTYNKYFAPVKL